MRSSSLFSVLATAVVGVAAAASPLKRDVTAPGNVTSASNSTAPIPNRYIVEFSEVSLCHEWSSIVAECANF